MEHILLSRKRAEKLDAKAISALEKRLRCRITLDAENEITLEGEPYNEYNAKNVLQAFNRGFGIGTACKLLNDEYFFEFINLKDIFRDKDQIRRVKARIIGKEGKAKSYIESVSGASIAVYGNTVSAIGRIEDVSVADVAIKILIGGGMHKTAYRVMEEQRRKLKEQGFMNG